MADVSVQNERINGWIPSSATNVILNWPERIKTQPHDDRDNCVLPFDSKGPCGMTVNNDIDDDSATKHGDSHNNPLKIFPPWGRMNFWLTVLTGISDPRLCLESDVHSLHAVYVSSVTLEIQGLNPPG